MAIQVKLDLDNGVFFFGEPIKELNPSIYEQEAYKFIFNLICNQRECENLLLERRNDDYLSIVIGEYDFLRFKLSDRTKWLSVLIPPILKSKYVDSPLFKEQKNKNQIQWKSKFNDISELNNYEQVILDSFDFCKSQTSI